MTKTELSQLYYLNKEIEEEKRKLKALEGTATNTSAKISGLPHVGGISDKTAIAAEIADARAIIDAKVRISIAEYNRINRYIASIDDSLVRQIISLRYVNGLEWQQVAMSIGGDNSDKGVQVILQRYLSSH